MGSGGAALHGRETGVGGTGLGGVECIEGVIAASVVQ